MRIGAVDIGTNSTRLLIADVAPDGRIVELDRRSQVTRLGDRVDLSGRLDDAAVGRVFATLDAYRDALDAAEVPADARLAVLTSAVRDAANGADFATQVRDRYGLDAQTIAGEREAQLTFLGATHDRDPDDATPLLVYDIGGGSTELVVGHAGDVDFHVTTQAGVVRQTERHIRHDPPRPHELQSLAAEIRRILDALVPQEVRSRAQAAIGVAGTATSLAAIDQELEPYDPARVHGYVAELGTAELQLARLAQLPLTARQQIRGLHPDRAPVIVAGLVILIEVLRAFGFRRTEVSEHDILHGVLLERARARP
ncbi:Ppx/GppA family phosphatase [Conexibacter arvalis]|uniref:Exopolyphosphatase/guanosine-5'-triphosphate, 3'-diphosphate pyrophosphatase n=1 Tax=Conexibacter arvalis TaxID=912552 RepID=A0A840ICF9_9ACTN|nr:Ppx/GppA family phosphatase [Conexibacter arvalis]MBB4661774.1 exopolyphosphatase/guanosine-5'-triphosphate,3'-diphosphate pyrophosphatase [Conexibacter arvalis]